MNKFSHEKALWHIDRIAALRQGKDIVPTHVQIILSDLCNQNCHFCAYRMDGGFSTELFADEQGNKNPNRYIPTEKAMEIISDCAAMGVGSIEFTGGGEPTVHKNWDLLIEYAQSRGIETGLVTNGVRLKPCAAVENLTWLRISLDAGNDGTYKRIRQSTSWAKVIHNIRYASQLSKPYVGVGFVVTPENYREITQAANLCSSLGVPYLRISAMFSHDGSDAYKGISDEIRAHIDIAKKWQTDKFKIVDFFADRIGDLDEGRPDYSFCGEQQFVTYIGGDLNVYTCCTNAYTKHGLLGSLKEQSFSEFLSKTRRFDFDAKTCHHCQFNNKNRVINWALSKPDHVNFV